MTARVVTVAGERVAEGANVWAPFGIDCSFLAGGAGEPLVHGGAMSGLPMADDAVAWAATDAVLALDASAPPAPTPCIRCSWCTDHCPARLNVAALNDHYELGLTQSAHAAGVFACLECGICSYICPARLPLAHRVRQLKVSLAALRRRMPLLTPSAKEN
jgi:electron transport complex protein RnfC